MNRPSVQDPPKPPQPGSKPSTSVRDDKRAIRIAVLTALIALVVVIAFNLKAPEGRLHAPGASPPAMTQGAKQTGGPEGDGTTRQSEVQRGDTPTASGREGMGAPAGTAPGTR